tara:strand:- start:6074 stop:7024 length:951 start_codon:yes stop_codon:yes gene_type:complete
LISSNFLQLVILISSTFLLLKISLPFFKRFIVDIPNYRSSHISSKPTSGGLIFLIISIIGFVFNGIYIPLLILPLALIGFLDDIKNLSSKIRFSFQIFTVLLIAFYSDLFQYISSFLNNNFFMIFIILIIYIFLACGIINFVNFMDGIDGLIAGNMILVFSTLYLTGQINLLPIIGSLIGFLILNWHPSKIFMGDVGSTYLGALLVLIIMKSESLRESIYPLVLASPILLDSFTCLIGRFIKGKNIFKPHRSHLYQRLTQNGFKHSQISLIYCLMTFVISAFYILLSDIFLLIPIFIEVFLGLLLNYKYAATFEAD